MIAMTYAFQSKSVAVTTPDECKWPISHFIKCIWFAWIWETTLDETCIYRLSSNRTWCEVHIVLVVAALEGVQGTGDLAGEFLPTIHALSLQMVTQVGDVILIPAEEVEIH